MKKQKKYPFDSKDDFVIGLYLIAEHSIKYFMRYKKILEEFQNCYVMSAKQKLFEVMFETNNIIEGNESKLIEELKKPSNYYLVEKASQKINLTYDKFKDYEERLAINLNVLINDFGDLSGASYSRFRQEYKKKKYKLKLSDLTDDKKLDDLLGKCMKARNYIHHFAEPKLLTWRKYRENQLKDNQGIKWPPHNIELNISEIVNVISILTLFLMHNYYYELFNCLQYFIRKDYACLIGTNNFPEVDFKIYHEVGDASEVTISENGGNLYLE